MDGPEELFDAHLKQLLTEIKVCKSLKIITMQLNQGLTRSVRFALVLAG